MTDFGNTVGDDFDRDSTPDKYIERKEAMTPLEAARQIIDARARATAGEWKHGRDISHYDAPEILTDRYSAYIPVLEDAAFIALSANHAAEVAQAYIDMVAERDYWRTIAQEGVGGLPLESDNNDA